MDIEADGFNIDPSRIAAAITSRTQAILCVHQMGMPCDMVAVMDVARAHGLPVIEDAACAIGSEIRLEGKWRKIGSPIGDVVCFSFHPRKILTTGEGGMLTTRKPEFDAFFRLARQHGMSVPDTVRHTSTTVIVEQYPILGYNYRMTDIQAAIGREQLKRLPEIVARRRDLADKFGQLLREIPRVTPPDEPDWARSNWQSYPVRLDPALDQRSVMARMLEMGIATRRGIMCAHLEQAYSDADLRQDLSRSQSARDSVVIIPLFPQMTADEQKSVILALGEATAVGRTSNISVADDALA